MWDSISTRNRPRTVIGPQCDHASAYMLIEEVVNTILIECDYMLDDAVVRLLAIIDYAESKRDQAEDRGIMQNIVTDLLEEVQDCFGEGELNNLQDFLTNVHFESETNIPPERIINQLREATRFKLVEIAHRFGFVLLQIRNKKVYASFPQEGSILPARGESNRIKTAKKELRKLHDQARGLNQMGEEITSKIEKGIIDNMLKTFWYPKIPQDVLIDPISEEWAAIIQRKKYNQGTLPRDNNPDVLCDVLANHIELLFLCYPMFHGNRQDNIIQKFVRKVATNYRWEMPEMTYCWNMSANEVEALLENVVRKLPVYYSDLIEGGSMTTTSATSSSNRSRLGSNDSTHSSRSGFFPSDDLQQLRALRDILSEERNSFLDDSINDSSFILDQKSD